jgi:hypothetical protein
MTRRRGVYLGESGQSLGVGRALAVGTLLAGLLGASALAPAQSLAQGQTPPTSDQGPRFGQWGPNQAPPAPEGPTDNAPPAAAPNSSAAPSARPDAMPGGAGPSAAPAPGPYAAPAPAPNPVPNPDRWAGCNWDLRGNWQIMGTQTNPYGAPYQARIQVRQYRNWVQIDQSQDNVSYYGVCRGDQLQLDVYQNGNFVGYQDGSVGGGPSGWNGWGPGPAAAAAPGIWSGADWSGPRPRFSRGDWDDGRARFVSGSWVLFVPNLTTGQETWMRW